MYKLRINIYNCIWLIMVAIATGIFLVFPLALDSWRTLLAVMSIIFIILYGVTHKFRKHNMDGYLRCYLIFLLIAVGIQSVRACIIYNYSWYELFYALRQYIWIFLAIPLYIMIMRKDNLDYYLDGIIKVILLSLTLRALTWMAYRFAGVTLFNNLLYEYGISWGRNGSIRIDATPLISIAVVGLYYLYIKRKNIKYLFELAFVFLYLLIITQTRMILLSALACVAIMFFFKRRKSNARFIIQTLIIILTVVIASLGGFDFILQYLDLSSGVEGLGYRYYELNYYLSLLEDGNWKWGLGILTSINDHSNFYLFGNLETKMYLDDLGLLECFLQFGLLTVVMYGGLYVYLFTTMKRCLKKGLHNYGILLLGILSYVFMLSFAMNLFGVQRSFSIAVILAFCAYINRSLVLDN